MSGVTLKEFCCFSQSFFNFYRVFASKQHSIILIWVWNCDVVCVSFLSDQSILANAAESVTDSASSSAALTRQVDLLERRNAELEQKLRGKSHFFLLFSHLTVLW